MFSSFMENTWIVATMVAVVSGCIGFFVVLRGASFAAHALPLGTFPGAAAASLLGLNPLWGLIVFAALGVAGIGILGRYSRREVATALSLVALLGLGTLFLSFTREYSQQVYALLFGEVLGIGNATIAPVGLISLVACLATILLFRPLLLSSLSPELAVARGISAAMMEFGFLAILALATATALPVVGALLVFSLMVAPASAARFLTNRPIPSLLLSIALALVMVWAAIALSYVTNWPVGFFIGSLGVVFYCGGRWWSGSRASGGWGRKAPDPNLLGP